MLVVFSLMADGEKIVYVGMSTDMIHHGHINVIKRARELGKVVVGLVTDEALAKYKRVPLLNFEQRKTVVENIIGVDRVIPQGVDGPVEVIRKLKPDYFVHGSDWRDSPRRHIREKVVNELKEYGGILVEPEYTHGISSTHILNYAFKTGITPGWRRARLRRILDLKPLVRILEVHNGLSGRLVEETRIEKGEFAHSII